MRNLLNHLIICFAVFFISCDQLQQIATDVQNEVGSVSSEPTLSEIINGLKEALQVGTGNTVEALNQKGGYLNNPKLRIPFPPDAQRAADKLRDLGMGKLVDDFENSLNTAAENAASEAKPIFVNAIKSMTFEDAKKILNGPDNAATEYFENRTRQSLYSSFAPKVENSLNNVNVTKHWEQITTTYNKIPLVEKVETDLTKYATDKALDGLFVKLEEEEQKIRENPAARVTDLLKKVFGSVNR